VEQGIAGHAANSQRYEEAQQLLIEGFLHQWDHSHSEKANETDGQHTERRVQPS
jgi:hypothetical protein